MKRILLAVFTACLLGGFANNAFAQLETTLPFMNNLHQAAYVNPSVVPEYKVQIGLPFISNFNMGFGNTGFSIGDISHKSGDNRIINFQDSYDKLKDKNFMFFRFNTDWLALRIKVQNSWLMFNVSEKIDFRLGYSSDLIRLAWSGNGPFLDQNKPANLDNTALNAVHYREYGLGITKPLGDKWVVGGRFNLLFGKSNIYFSKSNFNIKTDNSDTTGYLVNANTDYKINYSTGALNQDKLSDLTSDDVRRYLMNTKNVGVSVNAAISFLPTEKWTFTTGVNDLGYIHWKDGVHNYENATPTIALQGQTFDQFLAGKAISKISAIKDDARSQAKGKDTSVAYNSPLTPSNYLLATFEFQRNSKIGVGAFAEYYLGIRPAFTANFQQRVARLVNLALSYTAQNGTYNNLGFGVMFKGGPTQWYMTADNMFAVANSLTARNFNLRMGMNLAMGKVETKDTDKDGIPDRSDECPNDPGLKIFKGCPDSDKDGIQDKEDKCPNQAGLPEFMGCPDSDGDKIVDAEDDCPEVAGVIQFKGCPDKDNDSIPDLKDECPDEKGSKEFNGCPDRDGDKVADKNDECPDTPGVVEFKGCPDSDKDGVPDKTDKCPDKAGSPEHGGCPDSDKDGIFDDVDKCPDIPGVLAKEGCPIGDNDKDGVLDDVDKCPDVAGPVENLGCPYEDTDKDGLLDNVDKCPNIAGPEANGGCPYGDSDSDGLKDNEDACPLSPGPATNKGCPELSKVEVKVLKTAFANLEFETGKDIIKKKSLPSLNELASLMKSKPNWKLRLSGHTDNVGSAKKNMLLSKKRAESVQKYLISQGVLEKQTIAEWFGPNKPKASNKTEAGRKLNRRVEMKVEFD